MKYLFSVLILILFSCNHIETKDLLIIDNVQLGQDQKDFYLSIGNLGIKKEAFLTKFYYSENDLKSQQLKQFYYSEIFNLTNQKGSQDHYGLYYHTTASGTENIIGLTLLLGHTTKPELITEKYELINITDTYKKRGFYQEVHENLIQEYISMFKSKYGTPFVEDTTNLNSFYVIENNNVEKYATSQNNHGHCLYWETDIMKIRFFTGIKSHRTSYLKTPKSYSYSMRQSKIIIPNQYQEQCYSFPYISYELKWPIVEKLKLDKPKI